MGGVNEQKFRVEIENTEGETTHLGFLDKEASKAHCRIQKKDRKRFETEC